MAKAELNLQRAERRWRESGQGNGIVARDQMILKLLISIEKLRPLNFDEQTERDRLARVYPANKRLRWHWTPGELKLIDQIIAKRSDGWKPKPFQVDNEVRHMALQMGRSYMAVLRQMERRRKCSDAPKSKRA